ncbi:MAG: hypothetical protein BGO14_10185 [Chlamydiales bacterium 38-26]|nr:hypothetical protein [Chlamydiales bacterium]OJV11332.1 MAG: hypothetical protein BGO14_10185 [Chlamydiales bacterium 38-26]
MSDELKNAMSSLVSILREILANMEEEHLALLVQDAPSFQTIICNRTPLLDSMQSFRSSMVMEINKLKDLHPEILNLESELDRLKNLSLLAGADNIELLTLRDQILALTEQMEKQNSCNNYLLCNQVSNTANGLLALDPAKGVKPLCKPTSLCTLEPPSTDYNSFISEDYPKSF